MKCTKKYSDTVCVKYRPCKFLFVPKHTFSQLLYVFHAIRNFNANSVAHIPIEIIWFITESAIENPFYRSKQNQAILNLIAGSNESPNEIITKYLNENPLMHKIRQCMEKNIISTQTQNIMWCLKNVRYTNFHKKYNFRFDNGFMNLSNTFYPKYIILINLCANI